jgi:hypothetical protein
MPAESQEKSNKLHCISHDHRNGEGARTPGANSAGTCDIEPLQDAIGALEAISK